MIPRALPKLLADALHAGWDIDVCRRTHRGVWAIVAQFDRDGTEVILAWDLPTLRLIDRSINGSPTPYTQCTRLIRSPEGATS